MKEEFLADLERESGETPKALAKKPAVPAHLVDYWEAFQTLSLSRPATLSGAGAIQLTEIKAYCDLSGINDLDEIEELMRFVRALDLEFLGWMARKK